MADLEFFFSFFSVWKENFKREVSNSQKLKQLKKWYFWNFPRYEMQYLNADEKKEEKSGSSFRKAKGKGYNANNGRATLKKISAIDN